MRGVRKGLKKIKKKTGQIETGFFDRKNKKIEKKII